MRKIQKGTYRRFDGKEYRVIAIAKNVGTEELMVVYKPLYNDSLVYTEVYKEFAAEVDHEKYPEVKQKYYFEKVGLEPEGCPLRYIGGEIWKMI